ncbi:MAG: glycosyltransferase family 2 protein [Magnetococcus sp. DMHC-6]
MYNEAKTIRSTINDIYNVLYEENIKYRIICVDDGSNDGSWNILNQLMNTYSHLLGIRLTRNFGKDAAIMAGLEEADADIVIVMDGDGQHPPSVILEMIHVWRCKGCDIVDGVKLVSQSTSLTYRLLTRIFNKIFGWGSGMNFSNASDFKLLTRQAVDTMKLCGDQHIFFRALTQWIGMHHEKLFFTAINGYRFYSHWSKRDLVRYALYAMVLFTNLPIFFILLLGLLCFVITMIILIILMVRFTFEYIATGYSTLLLLIMIHFSFSMIAIGMVGLYVKSNLDVSVRRPRFIIKNRSGGEDNNDNLEQVETS